MLMLDVEIFMNSGLMVDIRCCFRNGSSWNGTSFTVIVNVNTQRTLSTFLKVKCIVPKPLAALNEITKCKFSWSFPNILRQDAHWASLKGLVTLSNIYCQFVLLKDITQIQVYSDFSLIFVKSLTLYAGVDYSSSHTDY